MDLANLRKKRINKGNTLKISEKVSGNIILASLIDQMGVNFEDLEKYINPKASDLIDPFNFLDMEKAVERIITAMKNNEKIVIYGDYDADGNTATSILMLTFRYLNYENVKYIIPNRIIDGYGMNLKKVEEIKKSGASLVITVDCGIKNIEEIEALKKYGIDTILTDHHEQGENIPKAYAVINPKVKKEKYPFKELAGAGVSFKLASALNIKLKNPLKDKVYELMLIASIGTIGDVMPIIGENRVIVKLSILNLEKNIKNLNAGLKALVSSQIPLTEEKIAYYIVPKINASGRMGKEIALKLLIEEDQIKANKYMEKLESINDERKKITEKNTEELIKIIEGKDKEKFEKSGTLFVGKENLHEGIIGIIASKISEKYKKPAFIYTNKSENAEEMVASSRCTNQDVNIYNLLDEIKEKFLAFGGHDFAAGFSFQKKEEEKLKDIFNNLEVKKLDKKIEYNNVLNLNEVNLKLAKDMEILKPYGNKNEEPIFLFKNLRVKQIFEYEKLTRIVFSQKIKNIERNITAISFKKKEELEIEVGKIIDVLGNIKINNFRGVESVQLLI